MNRILQSKSTWVVLGFVLCGGTLWTQFKRDRREPGLAPSFSATPLNPSRAVPASPVPTTAPQPAAHEQSGRIRITMSAVAAEGAATNASASQKSAFLQLQKLLASPAGNPGGDTGRDPFTEQLRAEARRAGVEPWRVQPSDGSPEFAFRHDPTNGGPFAFVAENRRQGFAATYGPDGLRLASKAVEPGLAAATSETDADWQLQLRFSGMGYGGKTSTSGLERLSPMANRMESTFGAVTEWYVNTGEGLEHGFTVAAPPEKHGNISDSLRVEVAVKSELQPRLEASGQSVVFHDEAGEGVLSYGKLLAYDSTGRELPTRFEVVENRLAMVVEDRDARYPVVIDPLLSTTMVRDINAQPNSSYPNYLVEFQGLLFFTANDGSGARLWKSDGTAGGTVKVGDAAVYPSYLAVAGDTLFFNAYGNGTGYELWKSDGTAAGTVMVKDIYPGFMSSFPAYITPSANGVFFWANDGVSGMELWKSDGTLAGTMLVKDLTPGPADSAYWNAESMKCVGPVLYFAFNQTGTGAELWRSDGTAGGTYLLKDIYTGMYYAPWSPYVYLPYSSNPSYLVEMNGLLYFIADSNVGRRLWKSDGTVAGTVLLGDAAVGPSEMTVAGNSLYFRAYANAAGYELWKSDGTAAGTVLVKDLLPGAGSSYPERLIPARGGFFFWADDGVHGHELWKSDGTPAGTSLVKDLNPGAGASYPYAGISGARANGSTLYFAFQVYSPGTGWTVPPDGVELWKSDGTSGGTTLVTDLFPGNGSSSPGSMVEFQGALYFSAYDSANGSRLWKSDGTLAGTVKVSDAIQPWNLIVAGNSLYVAGYNSSTGWELWKSDGTAAGIVLVKDIYPGNASSNPSYLTPAGNGVYFWATDSINGQELWKSDGTAAGTFLVKDLNPGQGGSYPYYGTAKSVGSLLYFAYTDSAGVELWRSDGTPSGTLRITDIVSGPGGSFPENFTELGGWLFFTANYSLWKTDGTVGGAALVGGPEIRARSLAVMGDTLYFFGYVGGTGYELWKTDGSAAGTLIVKDIWPGNGSSMPSQLSAVGNTLFFNAKDSEHGYELWRTDGTEAGTRLVKDIAVGSASSYPQSITVAGDRLYFLANDGLTGIELWTTDGTAGGTVQVADSNLGAASGNYGNFASAGGVLYFTATDSQYGWELHRVIRSNARPTAVGNSFDVAEDGTLTVPAGALLGNDTDSDGGRTVDRDNDGVPDYLDANPNNANVTSIVGYNGLVAHIEPDSGPNHGTVVLNPDGSFTYQPHGNFFGTDSFQYRAADGIDASAPATVSITVTPVNDAPTAGILKVATLEDTAVEITLEGNDVENGSSLEFRIVTYPVNGVLSGVAPLLTYTPNANFTGSDGFTFVVNDGSLDSIPGRIGITVTSQADPPVASPQAVSVAEDGSVAITLAGTDPDGDAITFEVTSQPAQGTLSGIAPNLTYTPKANFNGSDSFSFGVSDSLFASPSATVSITVTPVNDSPTVEGFSVTTTENTPVGLALRGSDIDGDPLQFTIVSSPRQGLVTGQAPNFSYLPNYGFSGTDGLTYKVSDGTVESTIVTVDIVVAAVNEPPVANPIALTTAEDTALPITLNGFDAEQSEFVQLRIMSGLGGERPAGPLRVSSDGTVYGTANSGGVAGYGTVFKLNPDGSGYTVVHQFTGGSDDGRYPYGGVVEDANGILYGTSRGGGNRGQGTVFKVGRDGSGFQVLHHFQYVGDGASPESELLLGSDGRLYGTAYEGGANSVGVLFRLDRDGNNFTVLHAFGTGSLDGRYSTAGVIEGGDGFLYGTTRFSSVSLGAGGTIYRIRPDGSDYQVLRSLPSNGSEGRQLLSSLALGPEGALYGMAWQGGDADSGVLYKLNRDGSDFSVVRRFGGLGDGFRPYAELVHGNDGWLYGVTSQDGVLGGGLIFRMGPGGANYQVLWRFPAAGPAGRIVDSPLALGPSGELFGLTSLGGATDTGTLFKLSSRPAELQFTVLSGPYQGTLSGTPPNLIYAPNPNFSGTDQITFKANDGELDSVSTRTVYITVQAVNDLPVANSQSLSTLDNQTLAITLTATDADHATLTYQIASGPTHGTLSGTPPNLTYTPPFPFAGTDSFEFRAVDAAGGIGSAVITINVSASDRPPIAAAGGDQAVLTGVDCLANVVLDGSGSSDPDGDVLTYSWTVYENGNAVGAAVPQAVTTVALPRGTYSAVLTVTTMKGGVAVQSSDTAEIVVSAPTPSLTVMSPSSAYANGAAFTLSVQGGCFLPGAEVRWNGVALVTTRINGGELQAAVPSALLVTGMDLATATVTVMNGDGQASGSLSFAIVGQNVGTVDSAVVSAGGSASAATPPPDADTAGVAVAVQNTGGGLLTVTAATYETKPVGETAFQVNNGDFVDVQIIGADAQDVAVVHFYYAANLTANEEDRVRLRYFDGTTWVAVLGSGGTAPVKDPTDNLDGTISGGRFSVTLDNTSTPKITELTGTVFGMFDSTPQILAVAGPDGPLAISGAATVNVSYAMVGDASAASVRYAWGDGSETTVPADVNGSTSIAHVYSSPGVYTVGIFVEDAEGDVGTAEFNYVVIYDPNGGFVTGGGWIWSPAGALHPGLAGDSTVDGKATFGFVARYQKGAKVPSGTTEFQFKAGNLSFRSTVYEWLVVAGARAQYKGTGWINGDGSVPYSFVLTAVDGQLLADGLDRFRIKIWINDPVTGVTTLVYDNQAGSSDNAELNATTVLGGGSIVIHKAK